MSKRSIPTALAVRGLVNGGFAAWLLAARPSWNDVFTSGAIYAIVDGAIGLILVALLMRRSPDEAPPFLRGLTFLDATLRITAGIAVLVLPGLPDFPVTAVAFYGAVGASVSCVAVIALSVSFVGWRRARADEPERRHAGHEMYDPFVAIGVLALVVSGYVFVTGPPTTAAHLRTLVVVWSTALAIAFTIAAIGVRTSARIVKHLVPSRPAH